MAPPPREEMEARVDPESWTVIRGGSIRRGRLVLDTRRCLLRFDAAPPFPQGIDAARLAWMEELLLDATRHWRMVRVATERAGSPPQLEIDLSGAPRPLLLALLPPALETLRWVVRWLAPPADLLAGDGDGCHLLEVPPPRARPAERKETDA